MPRSVKEIVYIKLTTLQEKFHHAQQFVDKLHESLESRPLDINLVNVAVDNMLMSFDEFAANFDDVCPGFDESPQTQKKSSRGATSHIPSTQVSGKDTESTDILLSRVNKLEEDLSAMRSTIHGGGDDEGSPHRGILSHLSVLENSFNEGKQQLISIEQKVQDINVKYGSFVDEMSAKTVKEDQQKEMENISFNKRIQSLEVENVTLTKECKNFEEKCQEIINDNDSYKQRLICVEDMMKSVKSVIITTEDQAKELESIAVKRFEKLQNKVEEVVSDTDACKKKLTSVEGELKTVKGMIETKEDPEKESENNSLRERVDKLEEKLETTVSDTDSSKDRLTQVDQLKAVEPVSGADLDSSVKTQILQRISVLENRPSVIFKVLVKCSGSITIGGALQDVERVILNIGNAFQEDECSFLVPVNGIYCIVLYLRVNDSQDSGIIFQTYDMILDQWKNDMLIFVTTHKDVNGGVNRGVSLVTLKKGEVLRARLNSKNYFDRCILSGWLVSPTN